MYIVCIIHVHVRNALAYVIPVVLHTVAKIANGYNLFHLGY